MNKQQTNVMRLIPEISLSFLARDVFIRTSCRAIAMMFVHLSVCLSVRLGRACIVIIRCTSPNDLLCVEWDVKPYTLTHYGAC